MVAPDMGDDFGGEPVHPLQERALRGEECHRFVAGVKGGDMMDFLEDPRQLIRLPLHRDGQMPSLRRGVSGG